MASDNSTVSVTPTTSRDTAAATAATTTTCATTSSITTSAKKRKLNSGRHVENELELLEVQINSHLENRNKSKDEAYLYAESIVPTLRRLTPYQLAVAKQKIQQSLFEAEYETPFEFENQNYLPNYTDL